MTDSPLVERERRALAELARLASERAGAEADAEPGYGARKEAADTELREARERIAAGFESETSSTEPDYRLAPHQTTRRYEAEKQATESAHGTVRRRIT